MRRPLPGKRAVVAVLAVGLAACTRMAPTASRVDVGALRDAGAAYAAHLGARDAGELTDAEVLALGYLERARLGLGSPFRLIEHLLRDPELPQPQRERLAHGILARTAEGRGYAVDPAVLDALRLSGAPRGAAAGVHQLRLIEHTIAAAPTAAAGERLVRLAYRIAKAEGTVVGDAEIVAPQVAALVADRRRARADAVALLRAASASGADPLALLAAWRADLRFGVESPALEALSVAEEAWVAEEGPRLALAIRALPYGRGLPGTRVAAVEGEGSGSATYLPAGVAERFWALAVRRDYPPQAPVAVAVGINRDALLAATEGSDAARAARARFADEVWSEERLVGGAALVRAASDGPELRLGLVQLQAAIYLRAWNQGAPWMPGDPAPSARDLETRFSLAAVEFAPGVRDAWKPYYLSSLARALADLEQVFPTASLRGLRVRFAELPDHVHALALHDPRTRTLVLPPRTGAGTLAHEIAHDLDWQLGRRRYGRSGYATDLAVQRRGGDRIALSVNGLAASLRQAGAATPPGSPHDSRPTEVLARGSDWFAAASLAREGRTSGFLTSYQDSDLTGYGTTRDPDAAAVAVASLLSILDEVAPVDARVRSWTIETYGPGRTPAPRDLVLGITRAGAGAPAMERIHAIREARDQALASLGDASCRLTSADGLRRLVAAQRGLIEATARAAARGAVFAGAREAAEQHGEPPGAPAVDAWLRWRLYGAPEPAEALPPTWLTRLEELVYLVERFDEREADPFVSPFAVVPGPPACASSLAVRPGALPAIR